MTHLTRPTLQPERSMTIRAHFLASIMLAGGLAAGLAGCTTPAPDAATASLAPTEAPLASAESASGTGACGEQIKRLRRVLAQDREMGHVGEGVHKAMIPQVERAAGKCRAGDQSGALAILAAVKKNHGYY